MKRVSKSRTILLVGALSMLGGSGFALQLNGDIPKANNVASNTKIDLLNQVGIEPQMGKSIALDLRFKDENGRSVMLRDYFNSGRPVLIAPVYYSCTMLCNQALNGMMSSLNVLKFSAGAEFDVLAVSFDPRETPDLAMEKRQMYMDRYKRAGAEKGIHFLVGDDANIKPLMKSIGFKYAWDERSSQYAHASALILVTPEGKVAQYYYGIEYSPKDMRLGIIEASQEKIGNLMDQVILYCFHYDPSTGRYGASAMNAMRISGVITVMMICGFIFISLRREKQQGPLSPTGRA